MTIKNQVRNLVARTEIGEAVDVLLNWAKRNHNFDLQSSGSLLKSRWNQLQQWQRMGIIEYSHSLRAKAAIVNAVLETVKQIQDEAPIAEEIKLVNGKSTTSSSTPEVILFLASNPSNAAKIQLDKEFIEIFSALQKEATTLVLRAEWAIAPSDLQRAILKHKPKIVHFSGHGIHEEVSFEKGADFSKLYRKQQGIYVQSSNGKSQLAESSALMNLFKIFGRMMQIEVVLLNGCHSKTQALAISHSVPYVIAIDQAENDYAALEFCIDFYNSIAKEGDIEFAFDLASNKIRLEGSFAPTNVPILYHKKIQIQAS